MGRRLDFWRWIRAEVGGAFSPENAKANLALAGLAFSGPPVRIFDWRSEMNKHRYLLFRRFLKVTKVLLIILWLVLRIVNELAKN